MKNNLLSPLRLILGIAGLIPFILLAVMTVGPFKLSELPFQHSVLTSWSHPELEIFIAYSAIILSFMAGTLWGRSLDSEQSLATNNIVLLSNVIALTAWLVLILELINLNELALGILALGFCTLFFFEYHQRNRLYGNNASHYLRYRLFLTTIVVFSHIVLIFKVP